MARFTKIPRGRRGAALLLGIAAFGVATASAASLGGITGESLGADTGTVSSCDTDGVGIAFTNTYDAASGTYRVGQVTVTGLAAACTGKSISVTLKDAGGASLGTGSTTVAGASQAVAIAPTAGASAVAGTAIVVAG